MVIFFFRSISSLHLERQTEPRTFYDRSDGLLTTISAFFRIHDVDNCSQLRNLDYPFFDISSTEDKK